MAIHPGAAIKLMDALIEVSHETRWLITTHSPELLDHPAVDVSTILAVEARDNGAIITPVRPEMRDAVKNRFYTVGELLRLDQLQPDERVYREMRNQLSSSPGPFGPLFAPVGRSAYCRGTVRYHA